MMLELRDRVEELESEQCHTLYNIARIQHTEDLLKAAQASEGETQNRLREAELSRALYVRRAAELVQEVERLKVVIRLHASAMLEVSASLAAELASDVLTSYLRHRQATETESLGLPSLSS